MSRIVFSQDHLSLCNAQAETSMFGIFFVVIPSGIGAITGVNGVMSIDNDAMGSPNVVMGSPNDAMSLDNDVMYAYNEAFLGEF